MSILRRALRALADLRRSEIRTVPVPYVVDTSELLKGRVALITGGAGGIGYAIAAKYIAAGLPKPPAPISNTLLSSNLIWPASPTSFNMVWRLYRMR